MQELKCYETKSFNDTTFYDYWNLRQHALYILADKKIGKPYMKYDEQYFDNSTKVNSLTEVRCVLDKVAWAGVSQYKKHINKAIQSMIDIPWTPLKY